MVMPDPLIVAKRYRAICNAIVADVRTLEKVSSVKFLTTRCYSFGWSDGDLQQCRVGVRPYDLRFDGAERQTEEDQYEIEICVFKQVARKDIESVDGYFDLMIAIADKLPIDRRLGFSGDVSGEAGVIDKRFAPLYQFGDKGIDSQNASARFESRLIVTFKQWVEEQVDTGKLT
jgi:hypothetical protein